MSVERSRITARITGHGTYSAASDIVDAMISRHLPSSPDKLRRLVEEQADVDCSSIIDVIDFLVILADFEEGAINLRLGAQNYGV